MRALHTRELLLDAGALRHAEKNPRGQVWTLCEAKIAEGRRPLLPVTVLAQMWRGGARQAGLASVLKMCELVGIDERLAKRIGILLGASGMSDIVDAMVVVAALETRAAVVTSDPEDLTKLADAAGFNLPLIVV